MLQHGSSNTLNLSKAWLAPERGFAVLVVTNIAGRAAETATNEATDWLIAYERAVLEGRR